MKIDKCVEIADGTLQFKGELNSEELDTVIQYGLNTLFALGVIKPKFETETPEENVKFDD